MSFARQVTSGAGGEVTIVNTGEVTVAAQADMVLDGAFSQTGAGPVTTAGSIFTHRRSRHLLIGRDAYGGCDPRYRRRGGLGLLPVGGIRPPTRLP